MSTICCRRSRTPSRRRSRWRSRQVALGLALLTLGAATPGRAAPVRVVTSIETLAAIARAVGGDRVTVQALAGGRADPHLVEPRSAVIRALRGADLLAVAGLGLESGWLPRALSQARNGKIAPGQPGYLDCATTIPRLDAPASQPGQPTGVHPQGNPHYWLPPDNAIRIAQELARRLGRIDPAGASTYDGGLASFRREIARRMPAWQAKARALRGQKVVTYHQSWAYVARWLGLVEVGCIEPKPGIPPSPQHQAAVVALMRRERVRVVIGDVYSNHTVAHAVARADKARLVMLPADVGASPAAVDYVTLVDNLLDGLRR